MCIYSNDNITKIAKLTAREFPHLVQNREYNHGVYSTFYVLLLKEEILSSSLGKALTK